MKRIFMCGILCLCSLLVAGCGCTNENKKTNEKVQENELSGKFFENQMVDVMEVQNFSIAVDEGESFVSFDIKNTTAEPVYVEYIKVILYDSSDNLVIESYGYVDGLAASETKHITIDVDIDLSEVSRVVYERM